MFTTSKIRRLCTASVVCGFLAVARLILPAEHPVSDSTKPQNAAAPAKQLNPLEAVGTEMTIGKSTNENLNFKPMSGYEQRQSAEAVQKLQRVKELRGTTNEWDEVARLLREVMATDARKDVKTDTKRLARLQLAGIAETRGDSQYALHLLAEYIEFFPTDTIVPEILLREGYLLREMGAYELAISKFHLVMTAALRLPAENLNYFQRVTLTAKSEIAETYFLQGNFKEAAAKYEVLLNDQSDELNRLVIKTKLIRSLAESGNPAGVVKQGLEFLEQYGASEYQAEVRYRLAAAYKALGQKAESLRELMRLLEAVEVAPENLAAKWKSWKMLAGNEIGNQLFLEGGASYLDAVQVYKGLIGLDASLGWQLPIYYQIGLCFEKLSQPTEARKAYDEIVKLAQRDSKDAVKLPENLQMVVAMARFRSDVIKWRQEIESSAPRPAETKVAGKTE